MYTLHLAHLRHLAHLGRLAAVGLATAWATAHAQIPLGYTAKELATCQAGADPVRRPDAARATRAGSSVTLVVQVYAHCAAEMQPVVTRSGGRMTIQLDEQFNRSASVASCSCVRSFKISFSQPVARGTEVYLARNGTVSRIARVP